MENLHQEEARAALITHRDSYYIDPGVFLENLVGGDAAFDGSVWEKLKKENGFGMVTSLVFKDRFAQRYEAVGEIIPFGVGKDGEVLVMKAYCKDGVVEINMDHLAGVDVVRGDRSLHEHEQDGELLIEFEYINPATQKPEGKKRRLRVMGLAYGLDGARQADGSFPAHRQLGEMDYSLVGQDTQYDPSNSGKVFGARQFPFWRVLGLRGEIHMLNKVGYMMNSDALVKG